MSDDKCRVVYVCKVCEKAETIYGKIGIKVPNLCTDCFILEIEIRSANSIHEIK